MADGYTSLEQVVFTALLSGEYQVDILGYELSSYWFEVTDLSTGLALEVPDAVTGHLKGSDQPLQVIGNSPSDDNGSLPIPPSDTTLYLPLIYK